MGLFNYGLFDLHSGGTSKYKIDCDFHTMADLEAFASLAKDFIKFSSVIGIPRGGLRFAACLEQYVTEGPTLIVDDVLTTGFSMEEARKQYPYAIGLVIYSRITPPPWIKAIYKFALAD
jgi:orotate phosphoribosyltransferase